MCRFLVDLSPAHVAPRRPTRTHARAGPPDVSRLSGRISGRISGALQGKHIGIAGTSRSGVVTGTGKDEKKENGISMTYSVILSIVNDREEFTKELSQGNRIEHKLETIGSLK